MARRNADRLETHHEPVSDQNPPAPAVAATGNSNDNLFSFVTPTEFVELPSRGLHYVEGHPLHKTETIEIRHMTAKEEDILTSEALIRKGVALDRLLQSVLVDKAIKVDDLLIGDKNAILIACRKTGYGPLYETKITCPACTQTTETTINLDDLQMKDQQGLPTNVKPTAAGSYVLDFEDMGLQVEVRLLRGEDEKRVGHRREIRRKRKLPSANITDQLEAIIVSVNDMRETAVIKQFVERVPAVLSRQIRKIYEDLTPDLDLSFEFECEECSHVGKVGMPLTAAFFWPDA